MIEIDVFKVFVEVAAKSLALITEVQILVPAFFIRIDLAVANDIKISLHNNEFYLSTQAILKLHADRKIQESEFTPFIAER